MCKYIVKTIADREPSVLKKIQGDVIKGLLRVRGGWGKWSVGSSEEVMLEMQRSRSGVSQPEIQQRSNVRGREEQA